MAILPAVMTTWVMGAERMYGPMIVSSLPSDQFVYPSSIYTHTHALTFLSLCYHIP